LFRKINFQKGGTNLQVLSWKRFTRLGEAASESIRREIVRRSARKDARPTSVDL